MATAMPLLASPIAILYIQSAKMSSGFTLGIPEDLAATLSSFPVKKTGEPVWNLTKQKYMAIVRTFSEQSNNKMMFHLMPIMVRKIVEIIVVD